MSNVLIGIIGVILFIGLALAGAMILGDDFKSASHSTQASGLMSQLRQAADAAEMRRLKLNVSYTPSTSTDAANFLTPRFLKMPAKAQTSYAKAAPTDWRWLIAFNNNIRADNGPEPSTAAKYVKVNIGPQTDLTAKAICLEIAEQYGQTQIVDYSAQTDPAPTAEAGCVLASAESIYGNVPQYAAYIRVAPVSQGYSQVSGF